MGVNSDGEEDDMGDDIAGSDVEEDEMDDSAVEAEFFETFDTDKDGRVTRDEAMAYLVDEAEGEEEPGVDALKKWVHASFSEADANSDGALTGDEHKAFVDSIEAVDSVEAVGADADPEM